MSKRLSFLTLLLFCSLLLKAQKLNTWGELFSSIRLKHITASNSTIYAASDNTIITYQLTSQEINRLSALNQLSDHSITGILYSKPFETLTIIYKTGNIDVLKNNQIYNIPYLLEQTNIPDKRLTAITNDNNFIYISGVWGVLKLNPQNLEIVEHCIFPGNDQVNDLAFFDNKIYAATTNGLYYIANNQDISSFSDWSELNISDVEQLQTNQQNLYFLTYDGNQTNIYKLQGNSFNQIISQTGKYRFYVSDNRIYLYAHEIMEFDTTGTLLSSHSIANTAFSFITDMLIANNQTFCTDLYNGLIIDFSQKIQYPSPLSDNISFVQAYNNDIYILYKPTALDSANNFIASFSSDFNGQWQHYYLPVNKHLTCLAVDPQDSLHIFIGTNGAGLLEVYNGQITNIFNSTNSPLSGIGNNVIIKDLHFDDNNQLWILSQSSTYPVVKYDLNQHSWNVVNLSNVAANRRVGKFILSQNNMLWANLFNDGLLGIDFTQNQSRVFYPSPHVGTAINSIDVDKDGLLWLATTDGVAYLEIDDLQNTTLVRPKVQITLNDTTIYAYLLDNINVTDIATDAGNRKWVATDGAGIFFINDDGTQQLGAFSRFNHKLITNYVYKISIDSATGKVYFITDIGLIKYQSDGSQSYNDFNHVIVYPNPVKPDFSDLVVIKGLMYNSLVKITDIEGNLVYETRSHGGTATWNLTNLNGQKVRSGVYLIFCYNESTQQKTVKKLLVIR